MSVNPPKGVEFLPGDGLADALEKAAPFSARAETRFALQQVEVRLGDKPRVTATDGKCLYMETLPKGLAKPVKLLIPPTRVFHVQNTVALIQEVAVTPEPVFLRGDGIALALRVGAGAFPDVDEVIPRKFHGRIPLPEGVRARLYRDLPRFTEQVDLRVHKGRAMLCPVGEKMAPILWEVPLTSPDVRLRVDRALLRQCLAVPVESLAWAEQPGPIVFHGAQERRRVVLMPIGGD